MTRGGSRFDFDRNQTLLLDLMESFQGKGEEGKGMEGKENEDHISTIFGLNVALSAGIQTNTPNIT